MVPTRLASTVVKVDVVPVVPVPVLTLSTVAKADVVAVVTHYAMVEASPLRNLLRRRNNKGLSPMLCSCCIESKVLN